MRLWLQLGEGNSWEGGGVGDAWWSRGLSKVTGGGPLTCPSITSTSPLSLSLSLLSASLYTPFPFPCGNVPMSWPHSLRLAKADPQHWAPPHSLCPHHPGEQVNPLSAHASSTSPPGPSPGQSLSLDRAPGASSSRWSWPSGHCPGLRQPLFTVTRSA